jgi:mRNA interferase MazF
LVSRSEVWWAEHPAWGRRPALVLTREQAIEHLHEIFVALATTTIRGLPTEVELGPKDGMPRACVLNLDHTDTIGKGHLTECITTLGPERMNEVCRALSAAIDC